VTQFPDLGISFSFLLKLKPLDTFEMPYLLGPWKLDYTCHSDRSTILVHFGTVHTSDRGGNTLKWPALFSMKYTKYLLPLVKKLPIFKYK
jgi:hypothetical protein